MEGYYTAAGDFSCSTGGAGALSGIPAGTTSGVVTLGVVPTNTTRGTGELGGILTSTACAAHC